MSFRRYLILVQLLLLISCVASAQEVEKLYYDKDWKPTKSVENAAFYRIITLDKKGVPIGRVRDYFITGELQSEFALSHFDRTDDNNNIQQGVATWYHKNGKKAAEVNFVDGKRNGRHVWFYESGKLKDSAEFKDDKLVGKWTVECDEFEKCQKVFFDDFENQDNDFGWVLSKDARIVPEHGIRIPSGREAGSFQYIHLPIDTERNFSMEATIRFENGDKNSPMGLIFGFKDWDDYFGFQITATGFYKIATVVGGIFIEDVKWTETAAINKNVAQNRIKVTKAGKKLLFSINQQLVEVLDFYRFAGNNVGFYTPRSGIGVQYQDLEVRQDIVTSEEFSSTNPASKWKRSGSGFFVDPRGYVVTNVHVIESATEVEVDVRSSGQFKAYKGRVIASDKQNDLAIIKIYDTTFKPLANLPYGFASTTCDVGTNVFAMGYPVMTLLGDEVKFTDGKISSKTGFQGDVTAYQISVPVQPGNSGGPLFDYDGRIVGVVNAQVAVLENVSYAVKTSYLRNLVEAVDEKIALPEQNAISARPLTEKIKAVSDYVVLIKAR